MTPQTSLSGRARERTHPPRERVGVTLRRRAVIQALLCSVTVGLPIAAAGPAAAQQPEVERGSVQDTFDDDLYLDLCGITTKTTVTEQWSLTTYPDGSQVFHDVRTFRSADPRLPVEKGAATAFYAADGSWRVVGKPIQLIDSDGGTRLLDAGWISLTQQARCRPSAARTLPLTST